MDLGAIVARASASREVADGHAAPTPPAEDDALEQGSAFADGAAPLLWAEGAVIVQALLVPEELLPGDVARVGVAQDDRPGLRARPGGCDPSAVVLPGSRWVRVWVRP